MKIVKEDYNLKDLIRIYKDAELTLAILRDWERKDKIRLHLLEITTPETLQNIVNCKKRLEDLGVHLLIPKN